MTERPDKQDPNAPTSVPLAQPHPSEQPGPGAPKPGDPVPQKLPPQMVELIQALAKDPQAAQQIQEILKAMGADPAGGDPQKVNPLEILDPEKKVRIAQAWNARIRGLGNEISSARGMSPGGSKANDEALLTIWFRMPEGLGWDDVDEYADACRIYYVGLGWEDPDKIEDQVMREVFPLRESLIKTGRPFWKDQVEFATSMVKLASKYLKQHGHPPVPDTQVVAVTKQGHGNPETMPRDEQSEAFPAGEVR